MQDLDIIDTLKAIENLDCEQTKSICVNKLIEKGLEDNRNNSKTYVELIKKAHENMLDSQDKCKVVESFKILTELLKPSRCESFNCYKALELIEPEDVMYYVDYIIRSADTDASILLSIKLNHPEIYDKMTHPEAEQEGLDSPTTEII